MANRNPILDLGYVLQALEVHTALVVTIMPTFKLLLHSCANAKHVLLNFFSLQKYDMGSRKKRSFVFFCESCMHKPFKECKLDGEMT